MNKKKVNKYAINNETLLNQLAEMQKQKQKQKENKLNVFASNLNKKNDNLTSNNNNSLFTKTNVDQNNKNNVNYLNTIKSSTIDVNNNENSKEKKAMNMMLGENHQLGIGEDENVKAKKTINRLKLDEKHLLFSDKGIKFLYMELMKQEFNSSNPASNLSHFLKIVKTWHFLLHSKMEFSFFLSKIRDLGYKAAVKVRNLL